MLKSNSSRSVIGGRIAMKIMKIILKSMIVVVYMKK